MSPVQLFLSWTPYSLFRRRSQQHTRNKSPGGDRKMPDTLVKVRKVSDRVIGVTINRPPVNAVNSALMEGLAEAFVQLSFSDCTVALLMGLPNGPFCGGADLKERLDDIQAHRRARLWRTVLSAMRQTPIPIVAAVDRACVGSGIGLITHCDLVLATDRAFFGLPEINVGRAGGAAHLRRFVPERVVRRMMLTGERITANEALEYRLIDEVVPVDQWPQRPREFAESIASKGDRVVRLMKRALDESEPLGFEEGYSIEQKYTRQLKELGFTEYRA